MDLNKIDAKAFTHNFLNGYLEYGFANMPKKEIDLLVLRLIIEHTEGWDWNDPPSAFALSQQLRVKRGRIRSLLDELSFRNLADEDLARSRLRTIILQHERDVVGDKVRIQIEDGYLREYAKSLVAAEYGIVDTSFDRSIISLSADKFLILVAGVIDDATRKRIEKEIEKSRPKLSRTEDKSLVRLFAEEAAKSAGEEAGKKVVQLGFAAASGGLSAIPDIVHAISEAIS